MDEIDQETLAGANGRDGNRAYIAWQGKVFDVTASPLWKTGRHMRRHDAGTDLTAALAAAPHDEQVFARYSQVGVLITADAAAPRERDLPPLLASLVASVPMLERHPHPMTVHFPIVFLLAAAFFAVLAAAAGDASFAVTARHCLAAGIASLPVAMATGFFTWWLNYHARPLRIVQMKIVLSVAMLAFAAAGLLTWGAAEPVASRGGAPPAFSLLLVLALVPLVSLTGWLGARLTFPLPAAGQRRER